MRLDKFLKVSRLIKRRTLAKEVCDAGRVTINGRVAKAGAEVGAGDILVLRFGSRTVTVEILATRDNVRAEEARELYRIVADTASGA